MHVLSIAINCVYSCRQSYIIHAAWADNSAIVVGYMSRNQTVMDYYEYTPMGPVIDMVSINNALAIVSLICCIQYIFVGI